ncbi:hypothetical protein SAMN05444008_1306 [Cnuella takakiae]|uniref:Uncharacterized protein n=1 Tax=Cnuella takakiae TaxID=1302690 RepID=A0A1M5JAT7_9BACT|nr:hypothetical protein [Cnuella takakiae]OLY95602.1 hypothetical protein BUE76_00440 [Cnuella takakiae]SHG37667.1 hypothetical protein SAMN05444008_1306 [Cnuella takakiae]
MKKSTQFILIIIAVILLGIFWRISGTFIQAKAEKRSAEEKIVAEMAASTNKDTSSNNPGTDAPAIEPTPYTAIAPKSEWSNILIGDWQVQETERNDVDSWFITSDIEFKKNKTFTLHTTVEYYDYESYVRQGNDRKANIKAGGKVSGSWRINNDLLRLSSSYCSIDTSYMSGETDILQPKDYSEHEVRSCDYFQRREYGDISNDTYKMRIEKFNNDSIYITGRNFATGANVSYLFTKKAAGTGE